MIRAFHKRDGRAHPFAQRLHRSGDGRHLEITGPRGPLLFGLFDIVMATFESYGIIDTCRKGLKT
jgi:hypothetical protein